MTTYYIQDNRQFVGNSMLWWRPSGAGYTTNIADAGLFNEDEIPKNRGTDIAWPSDYINVVAKLHVDFQDASMDDALAGLADSSDEDKQ